MTRFFRDLGAEDRQHPLVVARRYSQDLYGWCFDLVDDDRQYSRYGHLFNVALGIDDSVDMARLTQRSSLVSNTLLLSHRGADSREAGTRVSDRLAISCPDASALGEWILDCEPLLKAGLAIYVPSYREVASPIELDLQEILDSPHSRLGGTLRDLPRSLLGTARRAVSESNELPAENDMIRPIVQVADLPFVDNVSLRDFSRITTDEFASYGKFRVFLQQVLVDLDSAVNADESDRRMRRLGLEIEDEIRRIESEMKLARRKRSVAVSGAGVGTVAAVLVAIYGPALDAALALFGASAGAGGLWNLIQTHTDNSSAAIREDRWYYVWALAQASSGGRGTARSR
ncbi:hypothetical protein [Streptomyces sp. NPDC001635]